MTRRTCPDCKAAVEPENRFCGQCGTALGERCSSCGARLEGGERFCSACGKRTGPGSATPSRATGRDARTECERCVHFRSLTPTSSQLGQAANKAVNDAILKIREDEAKQREAEAKQKVQLIRTRRAEWGFRPLMSAFCAVRAPEGIYGICEMKNRTGNCPDFQSGVRRRVSCHSCVHRVPIEDPYYPLYGVTDVKVHTNMLEGINAQWAAELTTLYHSKGAYHAAPRFHEYCTHLLVALPFPNVHGDCPHYEPGEGLGGSFLGDYEPEREDW
jgi:hypothetical protein